MDSISTLVKVTLPRYFTSLPIPNSIGGFAKISGSDVVSLLIFLSILLLVTHATVKYVLSVVWRPPKVPPQINHRVNKESPKVVDLVEIEDLDPEKISYCRCWKSSKFPICDGSHNKHNEETKDNVGPLVLRRKEKD